jgi:hypothetical protein
MRNPAEPPSTRTRSKLGSSGACWSRIVSVVAVAVLSASGCGASRPREPSAAPLDPKQQAAAAFLAGPGKCPVPAMRGPADDPQLLSFDLDVGRLLWPQSLPRAYEPLLRALEKRGSQLELCVGQRPEVHVRVGPGREVESAGAEGGPDAQTIATCVNAVLAAEPGWSSPRSVALLLSRSVDYPGKTHSMEALQGVIGQHSGEIKACYDSALSALGPFQAQLTVALHILANGSVSGVHVSANSAVDPLRCCIARAASTWLFPTAEVSSLVHIPFDLRPASPAPPSPAPPLTLRQSTTR